MIYAVIAAGGTGSRMGKSIPKQYIDIGGKAIIVRTVEKFLSVGEVNKIIVLCPEAWVNYTAELIRENCPGESIVVIPGGETRNETLMRSIDYIESTDGLREDTYLLTHDAARPFVTAEIINNNISCVKEYGACGTAICATDTVFISRDGKTVSEIPDRSMMMQAQTPQSFRAKELRDIYNSLTPMEKDTLTDACKIYILKGREIHLVPGDVRNIKITYPHDLTVAESIIAAESDD